MLQVAYEDLASPDRRHSVLRSMVDFLNLQPRVGDEALGCAFSLADNPHIHRQHTAAAARDTSRVNIEDAYANTTLVCMMWALIRRRAVRSGYTPFAGVKC